MKKIVQKYINKLTEDLAGRQKAHTEIT